MLQLLFLFTCIAKTASSIKEKLLPFFEDRRNTFTKNTLPGGATVKIFTWRRVRHLLILLNRVQLFFLLFFLHINSYLRKKRIVSVALISHLPHNFLPFLLHKDARCHRPHRAAVSVLHQPLPVPLFGYIVTIFSCNFKKNKHQNSTEAKKKKVWSVHYCTKYIFYIYILLMPSFLPFLCIRWIYCPR